MSFNVNTEKFLSFYTKQSNVLLILEKIFSYLKILFLFSCLWIVFSGSKEPFLIKCGIISVLITFLLCILGKIISPNSYIIKIGFFKYAYILLRDVIISTIQMIKIIYSDKINIDPGTVVMNVEKLNDQEKILFANLITMTPGTFVIAVNGNDFLIHALNRKDLEFKDNDKIAKLLRKMRGDDDIDVKKIIYKKQMGNNIKKYDNIIVKKAISNIHKINIIKNVWDKRSYFKKKDVNYKQNIQKKEGKISKDLKQDIYTHNNDSKKINDKKE